MPHEHWTWSLEKSIPSERGAGRGLIDQVITTLQQQAWSPHEVFSVHLALEEALVNAIKHGNRLDDSKRVRFLCQISPQKLRIEIEDEGTGFDPDLVPDCTDPSNWDKPSGRGVMLMRRYMNRVCFNRAGNLVVMEKDRDTPPDVNQCR